MIIKGAARGQSHADAKALARHLLSAENELTELLEIRGTTAQSLEMCLHEMRTITLATRARRGLYHASINIDISETKIITPQMWLESANALEDQLDMRGHARAVVRHLKRGREHIHIVWCRAHPATLRITRDSQNYAKHEQCARALEARWSLRTVIGVHTRPRGTPRPVAVGTHSDWQAQERTGIAVRDVAGALQEAWAATQTGQQFALAIGREGFRLARGKRGIIAVDASGTPHSLPRRLQLRAAAVQRRLVDIDLSTLPEAGALKPVQTKRRNEMSTDIQTLSVADGKRARGRRPGDRQRPVPDYWRGIGLEIVNKHPDHLIVRLPNGSTLIDRGDSMTLGTTGEPSDEEIRTLVAAGKERGWETIRFYNGSPAYQRRARVEALRQGYQLDQVSLECEDGTPLPVSCGPLPEHIRRRLVPDAPTATAPQVPVPQHRQEARP